MDYRIRFQRNTRERNYGHNIAFYFRNMEECKRIFNFMRAINILEKNDSKDNFCDILKGLSRKFASQMAVKFRKALSDEIQKQAEMKETKLDPLYPAVLEIFICNKKNVEPSEEVLKSYADKILEKVSWNDNDDPNQVPTGIKMENKTNDEEFFESGFVLNYHLHCAKQVRSEDDIKKVIQDANNLIEKYGKKLKPHPVCNLANMVISQEVKEKNDEIINKMQTDPNLKKKSVFVNVLLKATKEAGAEVMLTDKQTLDEFDSLQMLATGEFTCSIVKVTHEGLDKSHFDKMAKDVKYYKQFCEESKQAVIDSNQYEIDDHNEIKVVQIKCNPNLTAIMYVVNGVPNEQSKHIKVPGFSFSIEPAIKYLSLSIDSFDSEGDMEWPPHHMELDKRGGLDYYYPRGWKGCGLKVVGKYGGDDAWLRDWSKGWAVAYHGVGYNPASAIKSILDNKLQPGKGQLFESDEDINELIEPAERKVGKGIYFAKKIEISEKGYSQEYEVDGKKYKAILQCRLEPLEIRIPKTNPDYYIVPKGVNARPYRILIKEV